MPWQDRIVTCNECGRLHPDGVLVCPPPCDYCYGTGEQLVPGEWGYYRYILETVDCGDCDGTGIDRERVVMDLVIGGTL